MDPCISHDFLLYHSVALSELHQSGIRTLAGDVTFEISTEEAGGDCRLTLLSRLAHLHHMQLSASLISIHFSPGEVAAFIWVYLENGSSSFHCVQTNSSNNRVPASLQRAQVSLLKNYQIPLFQQRSRLIQPMKHTKRTFSDGYWMLFNCPVRHNSVRLMASFTQSQVHGWWAEHNYRNDMLHWFVNSKFTQDFIIVDFHTSFHRRRKENGLKWEDFVLFAWHRIINSIMGL